MKHYSEGKSLKKTRLDMDGPTVSETQPLRPGSVHKTLSDAKTEDSGGIFSKVPVCSFVVACLANLYEYYDFALLGFFANEVGAALFPVSNDVTYAIEVYALYAVGFLFRPFGGAFFGYMGDKIGRKNALRVAMLMMSLPTFLTGCLPTYNMIGWWSPALLLLFRVVQGLSTGGENSNVATYVYEIAGRDKRAFFMSLLGISTSGTLVASLAHVILTASMSDEALYSYGWRIPFWAGIGLVIVALWSKNHMEESETFTNMRNNEAIISNPLSYTCTKHYKILITFMFASAVQHCSAYAIYVFLPAYISSESMRGWSDSYAYVINSINSILMWPGILLVGYFTDFNKYGAKTFLYPGCILSFLFSPILFYGFSQTPNNSVWQDWLLHFILCSIHTLIHGCIYYWYLSKLLIDPRTRVTLFGLGYNLGAAMFGGTASLIGSGLVAGTGSVVGVSLLGCWLSLLAIVTFVVLFIVERSNGGRMDASYYSTAVLMKTTPGGEDFVDVNDVIDDITDVGMKGEYETIDTPGELP